MDSSLISLHLNFYRILKPPAFWSEMAIIFVSRKYMVHAWFTSPNHAKRTGVLIGVSHSFSFFFLPLYLLPCLHPELNHNGITPKLHPRFIKPRRYPGPNSPTARSRSRSRSVQPPSRPGSDSPKCGLRPLFMTLERFYAKFLVSNIEKKATGQSGTNPDSQSTAGNKRQASPSHPVSLILGSVINNS